MVWAVIGLRGLGVFRALWAKKTGSYRGREKVLGLGVPGASASEAK